MKRVMGVLTGVALVGLIPLVQAQEEERKEEKPPEQAKAAPEVGARLLERFDLNKDGRVTWEEFQKVRSGFTRLDADGDGVLTRKDAEKLKERFAARRAERLKERAQRARDGRRGRRFAERRRCPDCDCPCHRDRPRFADRPRRDGPQGFRGPGRARLVSGPRRGRARCQPSRSAASRSRLARPSRNRAWSPVSKP